MESPEIEAEREAIIAKIHAAFRDVSRKDGISWSECVVLDNYGSVEECAKARKMDKDNHWSELVEDKNWHPFPGIGGFSFIDFAGFRYYLAPTMIRMLKGDHSEWYPGHLLGVINRFTGGPSRPRTMKQLKSIASFMAFMAKHQTDEDDRKTWADGLEAGWKVHL